ncbi:Hypothetical protein CINCED_3A002253 [Cinara cedri]|uniref:Uncharacterized protein n=1 Tax=Cinara cedri TaxID=506608 RepID=A0A5E4M6H4_9HEMI|nr:Hypothetical protein CINCED_3A002253 [Cinara cedri]
MKMIKASVTSKTKGGSRGFTSAAVTFFVLVMWAATIVQLAARSSAAAAQQAVKFQSVRAPRVYNALITTDHRLLPSRVDPIVTPVFQPFRYYYDWPGLYAASASGTPAVRSANERFEDGDAEDATGAAASTGTDERATPPEQDGRVGPRLPFVKNNGPAADSLVPDVPPPPLPVSTASNKNKKKPEEYPPPPVGFAM